MCNYHGRWGARWNTELLIKPPDLFGDCQVFWCKMCHCNGCRNWAVTEANVCVCACARVCFTVNVLFSAESRGHYLYLMWTGFVCDVFLQHSAVVVCLLCYCVQSSWPREEKQEVESLSRDRKILPRYRGTITLSHGSQHIAIFIHLVDAFIQSGLQMRDVHATTIIP